MQTYKELFEEIFMDERYKTLKAATENEMAVKVIDQQTGGSIEIRHPYSGEIKPEDAEQMYKKGIMYLCRTCTALSVIN